MYVVIYELLGQEVRKLVNAQQPAGYHTAVWDGRDNAGRLAPTGGVSLSHSGGELYDDEADVDGEVTLV